MDKILFRVVRTKVVENVCTLIRYLVNGNRIPPGPPFDYYALLYVSHKIY